MTQDLDFLNKYLSRCQEYDSAIDNIIDLTLNECSVSYPDELIMIGVHFRNDWFKTKWNEFDDKVIADYKPFYFDWRVNMYKDDVRAKLGELLSILDGVGTEVGKLVDQGEALTRNVSTAIQLEKNQELSATYDLAYSVSNLLNLIQTSQGQIKSTIEFAEGVETL